ncbi:hypothetical protein Godav_014449 [Gossypium davidsonii]|uniref:Small EDRK-rich factor-like N-terminal domain-containing protein n=2 Tax=Gossypium TaxID=3633 RepID=A0A7J8RJT3_GOSDV|nr:hypothetical protein [Gossypium davidsonii]MBA0649332.1 hypothetical protein [Gossypium klotzschianum]
MGGGNGQKSKMAREKNLEKQKAAGKGSQLESNKKAMSIQVVSLDALVFISFFDFKTRVFAEILERDSWIKALYGFMGTYCLVPIRELRFESVFRLSIVHCQ